MLTVMACSIRIEFAERGLKLGESVLKKPRHAFNQAHPETPVAGFHKDQEPWNVVLYDDLLDWDGVGLQWRFG